MAVGPPAADLSLTMRAPTSFSRRWNSGAQDDLAVRAQTIAAFQNLNPTPKIGPLNASLSNGWSPWKLYARWR